MFSGPGEVKYNAVMSIIILLLIEDNGDEATNCSTDSAAKNKDLI